MSDKDQERLNIVELIKSNPLTKLSNHNSVIIEKIQKNLILKKNDYL